MGHVHDTDTIGDLVSADFRAAAIFDRFGIDFCCGGRRSLGEACLAAGVPVDTVRRDLDAMPALPLSSGEDVREWPLTRLIDHILERHHSYVREALPRITGLLARLIDAHRTGHPELRFVADEFDHVQHDLLQHMLKEEQVLFPYLRELAAAETAGVPLLSSPFGTVENPIRMMEREHEEVGDQLRIIRQLTSGYATPDDGCPTWRVTMAELEHFERDLHEHVHLENNVLFPTGAAIERRLYGRM